MKVTSLLIALWLPAPAVAQITAPSILSRGEPPAGVPAQQTVIRPFIELAGVYDSGLTNVTANPEGQLGGKAASGLELAGGLTGAHSWRRTTLELDYRGALYHYAKNSSYDGSEQFLSMTVARQFNPHAVLTLRENGGMFSRNLGSSGWLDSSRYAGSDFFDDRTIYFSSQADFTIQATPRVSFNIGGDGSLIRRRSAALNGVNGAGARGDIQYRLSEHSTIGAGYIYTHYGYGPGSGSDVHGAIVTYAIRLTRTLEFAAYAGAMRAATRLATAGPLDPAVALLVGPNPTGWVSRTDYVPNVNGRIARRFQRGLAYIGGSHTLTPGNGLFLTSSASMANAGYTYTGSRLWTLGAQADYYHAKSVGNALGSYGDVGASASVSRQLSRYAYAVASFAARRYQSSDVNGYNRMIYQIRLGLGFAPRQLPVRLW